MRGAIVVLELAANIVINMSINIITIQKNMKMLIKMF